MKSALTFSNQFGKGNKSKNTINQMHNYGLEHTQQTPDNKVSLVKMMNDIVREEDEKKKSFGKFNTKNNTQ